MKVSDFVVLLDPKYGWHRIWEVKSIILGAEGHESLVELKSLAEKPGYDAGGNLHETTWVPEPLLRSFPIYSKQQ